MKLTKKAKGVSVKWEAVKTVHYISEYQCPSCKTVFRNTLSLKDIIVRFRCSCGQELIIK